MMPPMHEDDLLKQRRSVNFADPEPPQGTRDDDEASLSSCSSSGTKAFVEDSTAAETGVSASKRSTSIADTTGTNWVDDAFGTSSSTTLVIVLIMTTALILGSVMYMIGRNQAEDEFYMKFNDVSEEIVQIVQERTRSFTTSLRHIGAGITVTANAVNAGRPAFPLYTMKNLEDLAQDLLAEDPRILLTYAPLVSQEHRPDWEAYSVEQEALVTTDFIPENPSVPIPPRPNISGSIFRIYQDNQVAERPDALGPFSPVWQFFPTPSGANISVVNLNLLSNDIFARLAQATELTRTSVASELAEPQELLGVPIDPNPVYRTGPKEDPQRLIVQPIMESVEDKQANIVGYLVASQPWQNILGGIIDNDGSNNAVNIHLVVADSCTGRSYTYWISGNKNETVYVGTGDLHETKYNSMERSSMLASYVLDLNGVPEHCLMNLSIYPTATMAASSDSGAAAGYLLLVLFLAAILMAAFSTHNRVVNQRHHLLQLKTQRSNAIVAALFPERIRTRLFGDDGAIKEDINMLNGGAQQNLKNLFKNQGQSGLGGLGFDDDAFEQKQLADLYPNCTVMFADICGFTAWSSTRDPAQVFNLLETLFRSFDEIARRRRVFKVETIGDCYLAACGLPDPRADHAIVMARFARDVLEKFYQVTRMLEVTLGPDTGDLGLRTGMHSGPVTAGVLRGERGRFQLFGDTVNTGSRLETTGERNRIHISKETADLIRASGKGSWLRPRGDHVHAKGKGELETWWLLPKSSTRSSVTHSTESHVSSSGMSTEASHTQASKELGSGMPSPSKEHSQAKQDRLIFWVSESLLQSLRQVVARRNASTMTPNRGPAQESVRELEHEMSKQKMVLDEVREVITLPKYDAESVARQADPKTIDLGQNVETQLREYVTLIASLYQANPFHNFSHASHVTMSIMKLMSRIVAPDNMLRYTNQDKGDIAENLHDYTYGITSCPMTQFTLLLSAVIHDVDHRGISNVDLCRENAILAKIFDRKSVAEQNSIDLAWQALMDPTFQDLRDCIYTDATELRRFRQLVVNCVLATDIFDKELTALRKKRWDRAFEVSDKDSTQEDIHRKATIVIEHIIQASDVSHTLQHWQVYRKWNEHLFEEQYTAFLKGRNNGKDPSQGWYQGELWFFDNYVIPLAKKLKDCGVFGVSSDECLSYALMNREEWEKRGEEVVAGFVEKYNQQRIQQAASETDAPSVGTSSTAPSFVSHSSLEKVQPPAVVASNTGPPITPAIIASSAC